MSLHDRKEHIIEELRNINNESLLKEFETVLKKSFLKSEKRQVAKKKDSFTEFCGVISKEESERMKKLIDETFETIDPNEWK